MNSNKLTIKQMIRELEIGLESAHALFQDDGSRKYILGLLEKIRNGTMLFHPNIIENLEAEANAEAAAPFNNIDKKESGNE